MSLRLRIVLTVTCLTTFLVVIAGLGFDAYVGSATRATLQRSLLRRSDRVQGALVGHVMASTGSGVNLKAAPDQSAIQVLNASGRLIYTTVAAGMTPMVSLGRLRAAHGSTTWYLAVLPHHRNPTMVVAEPVRAHHGDLLLVGGSTDQVRDSLALVERLLFAGGALAILCAGLGAGFLAKVVLRPVDAMRRQAMDLVTSPPELRLTDPGTGDELALLAETLNGFLDRLQKSAELQRRFISAASHELRTPLAGLRIELENRWIVSDPQVQQAFFRRLEERVEHLVHLTEGLLQVAQGQRDQIPLHVVVQPLEPIVTAALVNLVPRAEEAEVLFVVAADPTIWAPVDAVRFREIVDNLVTNALRYSDAGMVIEISLTGSGGWVFFEVRDHGPGFPPEFLPNAFEPFTRAKRTPVRVGEGFGLGLSLVKLLTLAHGGEAIVANHPDGGAVARISLPLVAEGDEGNRSIHRSRGGPEQGSIELELAHLGDAGKR
ncbi:MAG: HAMP domain-containing sensor histidine kinase [Acidimicrobiales bacterium]